MNTLRMEIEEMVAGRDGREAMTLSDVVEIVEVLADRLDTMKEEMAVTHTIIDPADLSNTIGAVYDIGIDTSPTDTLDDDDGGDTTITSFRLVKMDDDDGGGGDDPKPEKPKPKPKPKDEPAPDPDEPTPDMTPPDPEEQPEIPEEGLPGTGGDQTIVVGSAGAGATSEQ